MKNKIYDVGIIGAGITGLTLSYYLKKKGLKTCLIEKSNKAGGVIITKKINGFICEEGPNTILLNNESIINLINDLKLNNSVIEADKSINKKYILHNNNIVLMPNKILNFIKSPLLNLSSKLKIISGLLFIKDKKSKTVYDFFKNNFSEQLHDNIIEPFLNGIYAGNTKKLYLQHAMPFLWKILKKNSSLLLYLMFQNKRKKRKTISFKEGNKTLIDKLVEENKDSINYLFNVKTINSKEKINIIESDCKKKIQCKKIVSTIPIKKLIKILKLKPKYLTSKNNYNPIDVFHFKYCATEKYKIPKGFGLLSKSDEKKTFLGILFSSFIFPNHSPNKSELITVLSGGEKQKNLFKKEINIISEKIKTEIKELFKLNKLELLNKKRWINAIPNYGKEINNTRKEIRHIERKHKNLHVIGNFYEGVSVSSCISIAKKTSKKFNNGNQYRK